MLKQLAPSVLMPPSPKNNAWMTSRDGDGQNSRPTGPSTMAAMVTPSAWPVVPPGSGRLNIMTTNEKAAKTEISGTTRVSSMRFSRRSAEYHPAAAPDIQHGAGGGTQVAVRNVHVASASCRGKSHPNSSARGDRW